MATADLDAAQAELQALAEHYATTHHSPALAWGVMLDGQLALSSPNINKVFRIASMTKTFTAATVLRLRDDGVLALDDPIHELAAVRSTA